MSVTLPPIEYVYLGSHNHATAKYSAGVAALDSWFDNVSYPAGATVRAYPDGLGVDPSGSRARVVFTALLGAV